MWIKTAEDRLVEASRTVVIQVYSFKPDWVRLVVYLGADPVQSPIFLASAKETTEGRDYIQRCYAHVETCIRQSVHFCDLTARAGAPDA